MDTILEQPTATVREAAHDDIPRIVEMGMRFAGEEYARFLTADPVHLAALTRQFIDSPDVAVLVVDPSVGPLTGMMAMTMYVHPMSQERVATEVVWWMEPEARGSKDALRLLRASEAWARTNGASRLQMIAPTDHVGQFYERLGFSKVETHYQRSLL